MNGEVITGVEILSHHETPSISDPAIAQIPDAIVATNGIEVDTVAGATVTRNAIIQAVQNALNKQSGIHSFCTRPFPQNAEGAFSKWLNHAMRGSAFFCTIYQANSE